MRKDERAAWGRFTGLLGTLAIVFALVAVPYSGRFHLGLASAAGIYLCFLMLLGFALLPGTQAGRILFAGWPRAGWRNAPVMLLLCVPYALYCLGTGDFRLAGLLRGLPGVIAAVLLPAVLYLRFPPHNPEKFSGADLLVGLSLTAMVLGGWLRNIWAVPVNLDFMGRLLLIAVASITWSWIRPLPGLGYRLRITGKALQAAALNFLYFAAVAIPAGFAIGFTGWNPRWRGPIPFALTFLEIFLFIALLEELFFRGFLQSLLTRSWHSALRAQLAVSLLFGLFHILHAPFPNWRYVALASAAGWFYGEAYRRGGGVLASALTHAAVDTIWRTWFSRA